MSSSRRRPTSPFLARHGRDIGLHGGYGPSLLRTGQDGVSKAYGQHVFDLLAERPEPI